MNRGANTETLEGVDWVKNWESLDGISSPGPTRLSRLTSLASLQIYGKAPAKNDNDFSAF